MDMKPVAKALMAGVTSAGIGAGATAFSLPPDAPWYAPIIAAAVSAIIGYVGVYIAPANQPKGE